MNQGWKNSDYYLWQTIEMNQMMMKQKRNGNIIYSKNPETKHKTEYYGSFLNRQEGR